MKLEIKLSNPKHCDDCPLIVFDNFDEECCILGYWESEREPTDESTIRPQKCIEENGL